MADFTKTISNSINAFGLGPSTKWGSTYNMVWGSSKWGEGTLEIQTDVVKSLSETVTVSDSLSKSISKPFSFEITSTFEGTQQNLTDAAGYYWIFPGGVTDADERASTTYTEGTAASTSWSSGTAGSTTWS